MVLVLVACGSDSGNGNVPESPVSSMNRDRSQEISIEPTNVLVHPSTTPAREDGGSSVSPTADATNLDADGDGWLTADEFQKALAIASSDYEYAPGFPMTGEQAWNSFTAGNLDQSLGAEYQIGLADMKLGVYFECSWMLSWIKSICKR